MKTITTIILTALYMLSSGNSFGQHMIFYSNEADGYSFEYPETWKRADEMDGKLSLVALAPEETEAEDGVREKMHITIFDMGERNRGSFFEQLKTSHQESNRSWKLAEDGEIMARNNKALYFSCFYSDKESGITQGEFVYLFINNKKAYVMTCTTSFDQAEYYKEIFQQMASSFSFGLTPPE